MILRNVTLANERQVLALQDVSTNTPSRPTPERRVPLLEAVPQPAVTALASSAAAAPAAAAPNSASAPSLTLETVLRWLELQSPETKAACAQILAPELTTLKLAAQNEGLELGKAQALREITDRAASSLNSLARIAGAAESAFALEAAQLAEACTDIVAEVFLKLAGPQLTTREAALGAVLAVLERVKDEREVTIRVSPADLPLLQSQEPSIQATLGSRRWTLTADSRVGVGGCLVESTLGTLDGRLEVQLSELCETLRAAKAARLEGV
jgi:flagellar biosynthesis/type III secretory pathway protein FliH